MRQMLLFLLAAVLLNGCRARIPEPASHDFSEQRKMQAAHHWDVLAYDVANRINHELIVGDYLETPVYVKQTCGDEDEPCQPYETSTFDEAFRDLLITELVNIGVPVKQESAEDAITVHYKVQLVYHRAQRFRSIRPGMITALTAGIEVLRNVPSEVLTIATAGVIDLANQYLVMGQHFEVIITTSMIASGKYLHRTSDIYYINDKDSYQYQVNMPKAGTINIVAPPSPEQKLTVEGTPAAAPIETIQLKENDNAPSDN